MSHHSSETSLSVAVDIGGTFTDIVLFDAKSQSMWHAKTPSTGKDPSVGFVAGIDKALGDAGDTWNRINKVAHGTTVATNLILEGKGARAGFLTTSGFRHVLEIGRHDIPRKSNFYSWEKPARPVPPENIFEIAGMLDDKGGELVPLDESAIRQAARMLRSANMEGVAICFLHSYTNPMHEQRAREIVLEEWPEAAVSLSCEVLPVFREYERSMATILNVYVMPAISTYLERLEGRLREKGVGTPLLVMKSNGGVTGGASIRRQPVQTALSGPAAGVVGAHFIGQLAGFPDLISVDIGGTSADISLIRGNVLRYTMKGRVGAWPLHLPMVDINTIGAGGGSIARFSEIDGLRVGPESAGAAPGPVCYGLGGAEPTVTDAHVVLGHLPAVLLDGSMKLDAESARQAIQTRIADPLGIDVYEASRGILALADNAMVGAIRVVSVERGHDPRDFALLPIGGAGPLHGSALARLLGIRTIIVPPAPGVLCALGLLVSNLKTEYVRTLLQEPGVFDHDEIAGVFAEMQSEADRWFDAEGVPLQARRIERFAGLRYRNQGSEIMVPWPSDAVDEQSVLTLLEHFHREHERTYAFSHSDIPVQMVTLHVRARDALAKPSLPRLSERIPLAKALRSTTIVHFAEGSRRCPIYDRAALGAGTEIAGPAIFTQLDTTTLLMSDEVATVDPYGNLIIRMTS